MKNDTLRKQIERGDVPISVHGYASTKGNKNQELSRQRAEAVAKYIRDAFGPDAKIDIRAHGEFKAGTPDGVEDPKERYVRIEFKQYIKP